MTMHREKVLSLLHSYHSLFPEELVYKEMMIDFISNHPGCFNRSEQLGHITASALLLNKAENKTLLTHHKKLNRWLQLGGHCDGHHDPMEVALREAREESGIDTIIPVQSSIFDIDIHLIPLTKKESAHYHYDIRFLLKIEAEENDIKISNESNELQWFMSNECPSQSPNLNRLFTKWTDLTNHLPIQDKYSSY